MPIKTLTRTVRDRFAGEADRAVSPVIGVVLMVAITVVLAAVIGAAVLGIGSNFGGNSAPSAQLSLSEADGDSNLTISHDGGDAVDLNEYSIVVNSSSETTTEIIEGGQLAPGESTSIAVNGDMTGPHDVELRHDDSGSIVASGTVNLGGS